MMLLLAPDAVSLFQASGADAHGWAQADVANPVWAGSGSFQRQAGSTDSGAQQGGGHGPYDPNTSQVAVIFLPPEAPVRDGQVAEVRGEHYHLSQARPVTDPRGTGDLDCWAATATWTDGWPP